MAMMVEVISRRFRRLRKVDSTNESDDSSFTTIPNLIMIDGGKGQLAAVCQVLQEFGLDIPVVGMTKREEELILPISDTGSHGSTVEVEDLENSQRRESRSLKDHRLMGP